MLGMDLLNGGPQAVLVSFTGMVAAHAYYYLSVVRAPTTSLFTNPCNAHSGPPLRSARADLAQLGLAPARLPALAPRAPAAPDQPPRQRARGAFFLRGLVRSGRCKGLVRWLWEGGGGIGRGWRRRWAAAGRDGSNRRREWSSSCRSGRKDSKRERDDVGNGSRGGGTGGGGAAGTAPVGEGAAARVGLSGAGVVGSLASGSRRGLRVRDFALDSTRPDPPGERNPATSKHL